MKDALQKKIDLKTKPLGSLGKIEDVALKIGMIQNTLSPELKNPTHIVFAADHGIADAGVSPYPKEVTFQMVMNFLAGGAAVNVFCRQNNIELKVVDAGVDFDFDPTANIINAKIAKGTKNILEQPAMTVEMCKKAMDKGGDIVEQQFKEGCNVISFGEMGIGNTSIASLLLHKFTDYPIEYCVGKGAGHDKEGLNKKLHLLQFAAKQHEVSGVIDILAAYGGFEVAMMCGAFLRAKKLGMVILVDGFITTSALLAAYKMDATVLDNCIFTHCSQEKAHILMLNYLKAEALVDLKMRLGEGTGAVITYPLIKSAVTFLNEMSSFEDAGVSNKEN